MTDAAVLPPGVIRIDTSGRRQYSVEYKQRLAQLTLEPGASVAGIALAHRLNANQLFKWRRWYLRQPGPTMAEPVPAATLLPVVVAPADRAPTEPAAVVAATERDAEPPPTEPGQIEIALGRTRVRVTGPVDPTLLETILTCIHRR